MITSFIALGVKFFCIKSVSVFTFVCVSVVKYFLEIISYSPFLPLCLSLIGCLSFVSYTWRNGPYRGVHCRFGFDPRKVAIVFTYTQPREGVHRKTQNNCLNKTHHNNNNNNNNNDDDDDDYDFICRNLPRAYINQSIFVFMTAPLFPPLCSLFLHVCHHARRRLV